MIRPTGGNLCTLKVMFHNHRKEVDWHKASKGHCQFRGNKAQEKNEQGQQYTQNVLVGFWNALYRRGKLIKLVIGIREDFTNVDAS